MSADRLFVYDKAKFHMDGILEQGLPGEHAYHHTAFFLSWLVKERLMSDWFESQWKNDLAKYRAGDMSGNQLYGESGECLISDMLGEEGNAFAQHYYKATYLNDYIEHFSKELPSMYHVAYTRENEANAHRMISERYEQWKRSRK